MSIEEHLRADAQHLGHETAWLDLDALFARVTATLNAEDLGRTTEPRPMPDDWASGSVACVPPGDEDVPPIEEIRFHMRHALRSASCARRAAELFELLGNERMAAICWEYAAAAGDEDAQDYVSEFLAPSVPTPSADESREQFADLVRAYA